MKPPYAHSAPAERPQAGPQGLEDHLLRVAKKAGEFASALQMEDAAHLLGLCHDLGKASDDFQAYLRRGVRGGGPGHSDPGAAACGGILGALMPIVQGHHGGLPDGQDSERRYEYAIQAHTDAASEFAVRLGLDRVAPFETSLQGHELEPLLRMLLSCLVDADHLDTEAHDRGAERAANDTKLSWYRDRLEEKLKGFETSEGDVARVRRSVQRDCRAKAVLPPGFFRLTVPTGGGKTFASLLFALKHAERHGQGRVVVAVPYTTVVEQTARVYQDIFGEENVLEHHAAIAEEDEPKEGTPEAETWRRRRWATQNWDHPLIVTTNVQLLDSLLSRRTGKVRKIHRLARSVIILDEAQTLPADLLQAHFGVLGWLVRHAGATVVLCTATQPDFSVIREAPPELARATEIVERPERHFQALDRVRFAVVGERTHAEIAAELSEVRKGLVVVNSRADSVEIFRAMERTGDNLYLSTFLCPLHRRERVEEIDKRLKDSGPCRVVSTQVIEAGIDLSFPHLWRARGPLEAVVQAAGRCNRNDELKPEKGIVRVFELVGGRTPGNDYRTRMEVASKWLDGELDAIASPEVQTAYFRRLLAEGSGSLGTDRRREAKSLHERRGALDYPFTERHGRMIEDEGVAVVVASWRPEATASLLDEARDNPQALRKLAPYTISLRASMVRTLQDFLHDHDSGVKVYDGPYDPDLGIGGGGGTLDPETINW